MSGQDGNMMERVGNTATGLAGDAKKMAGQAIGNEQMQVEGDKMKSEASAKYAARCCPACCFLHHTCCAEVRPRSCPAAGCVGWPSPRWRARSGGNALFALAGRHAHASARQGSHVTQCHTLTALC